MTDIRDSRGAVETAANELLKTLNGHKSLLSRQIGEVRRYHTWHLSREQTVADHTWHVLRIYVQLFGCPDVQTLVTAVFHDEGEMITGDMQHPVKRFVPALREVSKEADRVMHSLLELPTWAVNMSELDAWRLKACDLLEMYEFATRERMSGNHGTGLAVQRRILDALHAHGDGHPDECRFCVAADLQIIDTHINAVDCWMQP